MSLVIELEWYLLEVDHDGVRQGTELKEIWTGYITNNLIEMAQEAGIYKIIWEPKKNNIKVGRDMIAPLQDGLKKLEDNPEEYKKFTPLTGWGDYKQLVSFTKAYLWFCKQWPQSFVKASQD